MTAAYGKWKKEGLFLKRKCGHSFAKKMCVFLSFGGGGDDAYTDTPKRMGDWGL